MQNERYDQRLDRSGEKERNWDRRGGKMNDSRSGGFRTGKNTIEFKNQNRNKPFENVNTTAPVQSGSKGYVSTGFNQRQAQNTEYESNMPVESLSFTNSKLSNAQSMSERYPSLDYGQMDVSSTRHRGVNEMDRPMERPITGRQLGSSSSRGSAMQQQPLPLATPIHNQQPSMNIQQQISSQPIQQQPQLLPQQQNTNLISSESRSAKRYSTLRQRTSEAVQTLSIPQQSLSMHDLHEQQMLLQDAALMLQMQQSQDQIQLQPNLAHQPPPSTNYTSQPMPLQLQNEYTAHGPKSQTAVAAPPSQQPLIQPPTQSQSNNQSAQYPSAYFTANELAAPSTPIQPVAQSTQLMSTQQYPSQYPQQPAAPYVQPAPQTSYIQPAVNQQQQLLNYVPTIPPATQQFSAVPSFPTYPTVPNYNPVPSGITQSGITYYPPQTQPRPILSQRRPTNAIPILAPSERFVGKGRNRPNNNQFDEDDKTSLNPPIGSPENIDHILDNMFTQRPAFQPPTRKSNSPSPESNPKIGDGQIEPVQHVQPHVTTAAPSTFDGGNKQLDYVDVGMGKMNLDDISKQIDNTTAVVQNDAVIDPTSS
jgi:protein CASC3